MFSLLLFEACLYLYNLFYCLNNWFVLFLNEIRFSFCLFSIVDFYFLLWFWQVMLLIVECLISRVNQLFDLISLLFAIYSNEGLLFHTFIHNSCHIFNMCMCVIVWFIVLSLLEVWSFIFHYFYLDFSKQYFCFLLMYSLLFLSVFSLFCFVLLLLYLI